MGWYWQRRKKKKWKPGFWVYVRFPSPDGRSVTARLRVTPESFKRWVLLEGLWRGSAEAQSVSDINFKNSCQCQWDGEKGQNKADFASKLCVLGVNERDLSDIQ
jgi:hypothetical protein